MKTILITGCNYIGSHLLNQLDVNDEIIVVNRSMNNNLKVLRRFRDFHFFEADLKDSKIEKVFEHYKPDVVFHLSGYISVKDCEKNRDVAYFENVEITRKIAELSRDYYVKKFIFTSTASVYNKSTKIGDEDPVNVYGATKLRAEGIIKHVFKDSLTSYSILRLFNVARSNLLNPGVDKPLGLTKKTSHIFKKLSADSNFVINGTNHKTSDGTCVRDYIHVNDVAFALVDSMDSRDEIINVGSSVGTSVQDIVKKFQRHKYITVKEGPPINESPKLIADTSQKRIKKFYSLDEIVKSSLNFETYLTSL